MNNVYNYNEIGIYSYLILCTVSLFRAKCRICRHPDGNGFVYNSTGLDLWVSLQVRIFGDLDGCESVGISTERICEHLDDCGWFWKWKWQLCESTKQSSFEPSNPPIFIELFAINVGQDLLKIGLLILIQLSRFTNMVLNTLVRADLQPNWFWIQNYSW